MQNFNEKPFKNCKFEQFTNFTEHFLFKKNKKNLFVLCPFI